MATGRRQMRVGWVRFLRRTDPRLARISYEGYEGLGFARALASSALQRRLHAFDPDRPERLSVRRLAEQEDTSAGTIYRRISALKIELFGSDLSDSACYYRMRREREHGDLDKRTCEEEDCERPLPEGSTLRRRYCQFHSTAQARVARLRRR